MDGKLLKQIKELPQVDVNGVPLTNESDQLSTVSLIMR
jgi:hypothetical protein